MLICMVPRIQAEIDRIRVCTLSHDCVTYAVVNTFNDSLWSLHLYQNFEVEWGALIKKSQHCFQIMVSYLLL